METYRSGHNENDSKSFDPQGSVGSNPTVSARNHASSRVFRLLAFRFHSVQKHGLQELMLYDTATKPEYRSSFCREGDQYDEKAMRTGAFKQSS